MDGFDSDLSKATEKILCHKLNDRQLLTYQLLAKYGGLRLRSDKLIAGAQHAMSLLKCEPGMATHAEGGILETVSQIPLNLGLMSALIQTLI